MKKVKSAFTCFLALALLVGLFAEVPISTAAAEETEEVSAETEETVDYSEYLTDEIIIVYENEAVELDEELDTEASGTVTLEELGVTEQEEIISASDEQGAVVVAQISDDADVETLLEELEEDSQVAYVQCNFSYELLDSETSDPYLSSDSTSSANQYYLYSSSFTEAWSLTKTEGTVTVAVVDTGCNLEHEDLADNLDTEHAYDATTGTLLSKSKVRNNGDSDGHGTIVCGIIGACADNGIGIAGASYNANILPVKVFDSQGNCSTSDILRAYSYLDSLIESGELTDLKVINMSLGYYSTGNTPTDKILETAISNMLTENDVLTVCAGGNDSTSEYCYPADFDDCISVMAVDVSGEYAYFSDYNDAKDIAAYGVSIYSTAATGGYSASSGTSMASPQVAAAAALIWAMNTSFSAAEVRDILEMSVSDAEGDVGILDVYSAAVLAQEYLSESSGTTAETEDNANSWRYSDGEMIENPVTDSSSEDITLFSSSTSTYSSWESGNGLTSFNIVTKTTSSSGVTKTTTEAVTVDGAVRVGVDVSKWNGEIDWEKVAASGVTFAIIRCGYGSDFESQDDEYFLANVEGALAAGLSIGIYLYSYATKTSGNDSSASSEAEHVLRLLEEAGLEPDDLDLPVFYDLEDSSQAGLGAELLGDIAETFCDAIQAAGYAVGIYANMYWWTTYLTDEVFDTDLWYKWVARYPTSTSITDCGVDGAALWQFTSRASIDGIDGVVDVSFDYLGEGAYPSTVPEAMTLKSVTLNSANTSAVLKWSALSAADGYRIYRAESGGSYELMATIEDITTTTWTDTTVSLGTTYKYKIRAYFTSDSGTKIFGSYSNVIYITTKPEKVTLVSVTLNSAETKAVVKWTALSKGTGYRVYRSTNGGDYERVASITSLSTVSWTDTTIEAGVTYTYKVRAYITDQDGTNIFGSYSSTASVTTTPSKMTLSSITLNSTFSAVTVKWTTLTGADGYQIYRATGDGSYELVKTIKKSTTKSWKDTTIALGKTYKYKIRAFVTNSSGTKIYGSFSSAKKVTVAPGTVTISSASRTTSGYVSLTWKKVSGATGYVIYRSVNGGSYEKVKTISSGSTLTWKDKTVSPGTIYRYKIKAYYKSGSKTVKSVSYSSAKKITTRPGNVTISSAAATSGGNITVKWKKVSSATGYVIYRSTNGGSYKKVKTIKSNSTVKWTDTSVSAGKVYRYKIRAYKDAGSANVYSASYSAVKKVTAKPAKVTISSVSSTASKTATVKWKKVSGATGYQVAYRIKGSSEWHYTTVTTNSKKFTSLLHKNYYVKVRAYKTYNGTKYYGSWSSETAMKVK